MTDTTEADGVRASLFAVGFVLLVMAAYYAWVEKECAEGRPGRN